MFLKGGDCHFAIASPMQVVEERCVYTENPENSSWTEVKREAWVSSSLFGVSRAVQVSGPNVVQLDILYRIALDCLS